MAARSNTIPTTSCSTSQGAVTDAEIKRELVEVLNVFGKLATMTPDEVKATIRAVSDGLHSRNVRFAAYREAMTRFRIGACGRPEKDRAYAPVAPVIVSLAHACECELRASEWKARQRLIATAGEAIDAADTFPLDDEQKAKAEKMLAKIRDRLRIKTIPKESAHGKS